MDLDCQDFKVGSLLIVVDVKKAESVDTSALATAKLVSLKIEYRERMRLREIENQDIKGESTMSLFDGLDCNFLPDVH